MDNRPIGVFDSGIGGLPVLCKLKKAFGRENFLYLGDNGNVPYGSRPEEEIVALATRGIGELFSLGAKAVAVACNTASVALFRLGFSDARVILLLPGIGDGSMKEKRGVFFGTPATAHMMQSGAFFDGFERLSFVPLENLASEIEKNAFAAQEFVLRNHFCPQAVGADFIYLGCTHYLYAERDFNKVYKPRKIFDGTEYMIDKLTYYLYINNMYGENNGACRFVGDYAEMNEKVCFSLSERGSN